MNLNTITEVRRFAGAEPRDVEWRDGDSWLAGGTWLFSEPQPHLRRLLDLTAVGWEPLVVGERRVCGSPRRARSPSCYGSRRRRSGSPRR